jgi:hypothetical protein
MMNETHAVVTQHHTHDPELCPIRLWAAIAKQILSYPGTNHKTSVNTYMHRGKLSEVSSKMMAMYLANIPVFAIMLIGCWSSDAFLQYICCQVQEFSSCIASLMITSSDFYMIPDFTHRDNPQVSGNFHNFAALSNIGHDAQQLARLPRFSLHH